MKQVFKNVRIVTDKGEALLISQHRYDCLIQTLDLLASGAHKRNRRQPRPGKSFPVRS